VVARTAEQRDAKARATPTSAARPLAAGAGGVLERGLALKLEQTRNKIRQYEADVRAGVADSAFALSQLERRREVFDSGSCRSTTSRTPRPSSTRPPPTSPRSAPGWPTPAWT
jgi:hypothetical protein